MDSISFWLENELSILEQLIEKYPKEKFSKGSIIHQQGCKFNNFFFLHEGIVKISVFSSDGLEKILGYHLSRSLFGMDCLGPECNAVVTSTALTDIIVTRIKYEHLIQLIKDSPSLRITLLNYYCKVLRLMCFQAENLSFYDAITRVANFLYIYTPKVSSNPKDIEVSLTEQELSNLTAVSRVHISRVLKAMREKGIITKSRGRIFIKDLQKLFDLCQLS